MKKQYSIPEAEFFLLLSQDLITTSFPEDLDLSQPYAEDYSEWGIIGK